MEAAAKTVQLLSQRILPEKPHHLSYSPDWRYQVPANESKSKHFEEWENPRLQYTTLVSEADRGVLLTRSYYDMRVDPPRPAPRDVSALAKAGGEKKKLSLSDYKNKKTTGGTDSTPEPVSAKKRDLDRGHGQPKSLPDPVGKLDGHRSRDHPAAKPPRIQENTVDMRLPPKPPGKASLPPRPVSPDSRKRYVDIDDDSRLQKRARQDGNRVPDDRSRLTRDEPPRRKDRDSLAPSDYPSQRDRDRDGKPSASSLTNGRSVLKSATAPGRNPSPAGRARGDSLNGVRPSLSGSTKGTPTKADLSRPSLPPLLSPLHLNLDSRDGSDRGEKKKPREEPADSARPAKPKKPEELPKAKRERSPMRIPPLLSPTLPQMLELELTKRGKPSSKLDKIKDEKDREDRSERQSEERQKEDRPPARKAPVDQDEEESSGKERRKSLIVTLFISKRMRQTIKRILALPARKEPSRQERSVSSEAPPAQAKKRPVSSGEIIADSISVKRPRTSSISSSSRLPPPPSTPSKKGTTAMSRVSSSNSQAYTPGDQATATPSAPGSSDRPIVNGTDGARADKTEIRALHEKHSRFSNLGRRLKHNGDVAMKRASQSNGGPRGSEPSVKLGHVLQVESIIAFMTSFHALNVWRGLSGKACDPTSWETLFPLLEYIQREVRRHDMRRYQPLHALILMLHAVVVEEVLRCYGTFENPGSHISIQDLIRHERTRTRLWPAVREANETIDHQSLRASITPWSTLDEISNAALRILRHWCTEENVEWTPEVSFKEENGSRSNVN